MPEAAVIGIFNLLIPALAASLPFNMLFHATHKDSPLAFPSRRQLDRLTQAAAFFILLLPSTSSHPAVLGSQQMISRLQTEQDLLESFIYAVVQTLSANFREKSELSLSFSLL